MLQTIAPSVILIGVHLSPVPPNTTASASASAPAKRERESKLTVAEISRDGATGTDLQAVLTDFLEEEGKDVEICVGAV